MKTGHIRKHSSCPVEYSVVLPHNHQTEEFRQMTVVDPPDLWFRAYDLRYLYSYRMLEIGCKMHIGDSGFRAWGLGTRV
jgi:hypothetical protein